VVAGRRPVVLLAAVVAAPACGVVPPGTLTVTWTSSVGCGGGRTESWASVWELTAASSAGDNVVAAGAGVAPSAVVLDCTTSGTLMTTWWASTDAGGASICITVLPSA